MQASELQRVISQWNAPDHVDTIFPVKDYARLGLLSFLFRNWLGVFFEG
jgi:hypothetical protein